MKQIKLLFAFLFLFSIKSNAQYFEGTITYKRTETPPLIFTEMYTDTTWTYTVKDSMIRSEYSGAFTDFYFMYGNNKSGEIVTYEIDTINKFVEIFINKADDIYSPDEFKKKFKSKRNKNMKILGYNCKHYYVKSKNSRMDYWITDSIIPKINGSILLKDRGIILKTIFIFKPLNSVTVDEAVAINSKPISSELFKIPADCKPRKSNLPKAMKKYGVDEKLIPRDSLKHVKDTTKMDFGKWGDDN